MEHLLPERFPLELLPLECLVQERLTCWVTIMLGAIPQDRINPRVAFP